MGALASMARPDPGVAQESWVITAITGLDRGCCEVPARKPPRGGFCWNDPVGNPLTRGGNSTAEAAPVPVSVSLEGDGRGGRRAAGLGTDTFQTAHQAVISAASQIGRAHV